MNVYCNNCGIKGHVFKDCLSPILSCGIILCKKYEDIYKVLMINRKDSLCYIDFVRGKYNLMDLDYIQILINKITIGEKHRLLIKSFDEYEEPENPNIIIDTENKNLEKSSNYIINYLKINSLLIN